MNIARSTDRFFENLRAQMRFVIEFKTRDLPKRISSVLYLTIVLALFSGHGLAALYAVATLGLETARYHVNRRLRELGGDVTNLQALGYFGLDVASTSIHALPAVGLAASGSTTGLIIGVLWIASITAHNVSGMALIKIFCWATLLPLTAATFGTMWAIFHTDFAPPEKGDGLIVVLAALFFAVNVVDVTYRQRSIRDAFDTARSEARDRLIRLDYLASHDELTGLLNRRAFDEDARDAVQFGGRVALVAIDLDRFKPINDTYGHAAGDAVLKALAARIAEHGGSNPAARMGGDEFALLIPHVDDPQQVTRLIERLQTALEQPIMFEGVALHLGASIGHALQSERTPDYETLAREADAAMYRIKQGKTRRLSDLAG